MPRVPPFDRPATYADLVALPDNVVGEIVDGELHASPRPAPRDAAAGSAVGAYLLQPFAYGRGGPGGWFIVYEPELHLGDEIVVPDWAGWRRSRLPAPPASAYFELAPDWICEVLSPSTAAFDRAGKLPVYARSGTEHAWLIDPVAHTLEVLRIDHGRWTIETTHAGEEVVRASPFSEIEIRLGDFWTDVQEAG